MNLIQSVRNQVREIQELWCRIRKDCDVPPVQNTTLEWLERQEKMSIKKQHDLFDTFITGRDHTP